eukprot:12239970-Alexandrium_andersonii.AAC.1
MEREGGGGCSGPHPLVAVRRGEQSEAGTRGEAPAQRHGSNAPCEGARGGSRVLDAARESSAGLRGAGGRAAPLAQAAHGQSELR